MHRFDKHKLVIGTIASIIRTNFWEAQPSWKKFSKDQRDMWFDIFKVIVKSQALIERN